MKLTWQTFKLLILIGLIPPSYFQIMDFVQLGKHKMETLPEFLFWAGLSLTVTIALSLVIFQEIKWLEKKLPWKKYIAKRIIAEFLLTNATVLGVMYIVSVLTWDFHCKLYGLEYGFKEHVAQELTIGVVLLTILVCLVEGTYFFNEWKKSILLSEQLKKENFQAQLETLKTQVSPHFLFNCLNVLSNLVHIDANRAEEFIDQFAKVYRYILNIQDKMAVTLKEEITFIESYIFLQKIRFQDGFEVNIDIAPECESFYVAPLSLQMLVENAIKHNVVDKESPLLVNIFMDNGKVLVTNKINLRTDENKSVGMGLKNLRQRYFLLAGIEPEFKEENGVFLVTIPLIKPEQNESKYEQDACCNYRRRKLRGR